MVFPNLPVPEIYALVENGIVTRVVAVENFQYIIDNPDRYGDSSLYIRTYNDNPAKRYGAPGMAYNSDTGEFFNPDADNPADFPEIPLPPRPE